MCGDWPLKMLISKSIKIATRNKLPERRKDKDSKYLKHKYYMGVVEHPF